PPRNPDCSSPGARDRAAHALAPRRPSTAGAVPSLFSRLLGADPATGADLPGTRGLTRGGLTAPERSVMVTLEEQIAEAQRELALRRKCYPAWVKSGKLDAGDAKYKIVGMEEKWRTSLR